MRTEQSIGLFRFYKNASRISRLMGALADRDLPAGMTMSRFEMLDVVAGSDLAMTPQEIARELNLTPAAVTHLAGQLARQGYLETRPDPADRRAKRICLSQKGRSMHRESMIALSGLTSLLLKKFADTDFDIPNRLLEEFAVWLENHDSNG